MTRARLLALAERRALLRTRAQQERAALASLVGRADGAAGVAVRLLSGAERVLEEIKRRPLFAAAGVALFVALRPRRALGWLAKGWSLWRLYRGAQRWWQRYAAAPAEGR
jgi:hypothetical protein